MLKKLNSANACICISECWPNDGRAHSAYHSLNYKLWIGSLQIIQCHQVAELLKMHQETYMYIYTSGSLYDHALAVETSIYRKGDLLF